MWWRNRALGKDLKKIYLLRREGHKSNVEGLYPNVVLIGFFNILFTK